MVIHKIPQDDKVYHVTAVMVPYVMCMQSDQTLRLAVEEDGEYTCEEVVIGPIQVALLDITKKHLNSYADKLCKSLKAGIGN